MPYQECDSEELQESLRRYRRATERTQNTMAEIELFLRELNQLNELKGLESLKKAGELMELGGQVTGAMREPTGQNIAEALGKVVAECAEEMIEAEKAGHAEANQAERLRILQERLRLDLEDEVDRREEAQRHVDAFWECTDRLAPRRVCVSLTMQATGGFLGITTRSEVRCEGEAELTSIDAHAPLERPWQCLQEPELVERFQGTGALTVTVPVYEWVSTGSAVQVSGVKHEVLGGPLTFEVVVRWSRARPSRLDLLRITPRGSLTMHVEGTVVAFGQGQTFASDQDVGRTATVAFALQVGTLAPRFRMEAAPASEWHGADALERAWGRSALDVRVMR